MSDREPMMTPEQYAEMILINIVPYENLEYKVKTKDGCQKWFESGATFKWMLDKENFNLKIWIASNNPPIYDHSVVDREVHYKRTYGQVNNQYGLEFRTKEVFTQLEKEGIKIALEKFFGRKIKFSKY